MLRFGEVGAKRGGFRRAWGMNGWEGDRRNGRGYMNRRSLYKRPIIQIPFRSVCRSLLASSLPGIYGKPR